MNKKIQVAILVDSLATPAWVYRSVEHIKQLDTVDINSVFVCSDKKNKGSLHQILNQVQSRLFDGDINAPDYREIKELHHFISDVSKYQLGDKTSSGWESRFVSKLKEVKADVLIKYTDYDLPETIISELKYGVWDHLFNAGSSHQRSYEGFWETLLSEPEIGSSLQLIHHKHPKQSLFKSFSCTHEASIYGTNNPNYWKSSSFAVRALKRLVANNLTFFNELNTNDLNETQPNSARKYPNIIQYALLLSKKIMIKIAKKIKYKQVFEQWFLLYHLKPDAEISSYTKMLPPKEVFWADPHIVYENDHYYIFIEELPFAVDKGYLSVIEMDQKGQYSPPVKILEKAYHLSYPNVFQYKDHYYMIPETNENKTIELYRCTEFPHQWEFIMNLMEEVKAVDTTLHFQDDKWWLFTNMVENPGASSHEELFLFYTEDDFLTTNWTPHPLNPIVSDVKTARPAGKIYIEDGKVYRPSQNCSHHYGYGINTHEITVLNTNNYQEHLVKSIEPSWDKNIIATHTYSKVKELCVLDGIILRKN